MAANLCAVAVGTETDGSIVSPASVNGIVGIKPTVGLVSRTRRRADIAQPGHRGPAGADGARRRRAARRDGRPRLRDPASAAVGARFESDYARYLDLDGLRGARLGVARRFFADNAPLNCFLDALRCDAQTRGRRRGRSR